MITLSFSQHDKLCLKKKHPCGSDVFTVARCGSDVRIICDGCGRDMTLERTKLEKSVRKVIKTTQGEI